MLIDEATITGAADQELIFFTQDPSASGAWATSSDDPSLSQTGLFQPPR
jgi:hypothetical protein